MMQFKPSPDLAFNCCLSAWWGNGFTDDELDMIIKMGEELNPQPALVGYDIGESDKKIRNSNVSWLKAEGWLADKLEYIVQQLNGKYFGLDLWGFGEAFQYTTYIHTKKEKKIKQHYTWHMDQGPSLGSPRKLSLILQLSDPKDYEGGDLEIMTGTEPEIRKKQRGIIHAFPSYVMHRVTPITSGIRRTLVIWISGPKLR